VCRLYVDISLRPQPSVRPPVRRRKRRKIEMSDRHTYIHTSRVSTRELEHHTYIDGRKGVVMRGENASSSAVVMATGVSTACCTQQASSVCVCLSVCASTYLCIYHRYMYTYIYIPGPRGGVHAWMRARTSVRLRPASSEAACGLHVLWPAACALYVCIPAPSGLECPPELAVLAHICLDTLHTYIMWSDVVMLRSEREPSRYLLAYYSIKPPR